MKRNLLVATLILSSLMIFSACGNTSDTPAQNSSGSEIEGSDQVDGENTENKDADNTQEAGKTGTQSNTKSKAVTYLNKIGDLSKGMYMKAEASIEGTTNQITTVKSGEKEYSSYKSDNEEMATIFDYDKKVMYYLIPAKKMYYTIDMTDNDVSQKDTSMDYWSYVNDKASFGTGTMDIEGKKYDYEEFTSGTEKERFCFDGDKLAYIVSVSSSGEQHPLKIIELSTKIDSSVFEIPSDYTKIQ